MAPKPEPRARSYKDFLTPAMHRRFTAACTAGLIACYLESLVISEGNYFWRIVPLSTNAIRIMMLFICVMITFVVRLSNLEVGKRNTTSGFETFYQHITSVKTYVTLIWYIGSAWIFGEIYIWSKGNENNLGWVDHGREYERPRLNENPVFLRCLYAYLAVVQTCAHLYSERDTVALLNDEKKTLQRIEQESKSVSPALKMQAELPSIANRSFQLAITSSVTIFPVYLMLLRRTAWSWNYVIGRVFVTNLPKNASPTGFVHLPGLLWQGWSSCFLLIVLWAISNSAFTAYVSEPPVKKGNPLTSEIKDNAGSYITKSQDPNGSLLNGLNSKKDIPKTFAFWELYLICTQFASRRKSIYSEVDRKTGSTWTQVSKACLSEISDIRTRIRAAQDPVEGRAKYAAEELARKQQEHLIAAPQTEPLGLPSIANRGLQEGEVFAQQSSSFYQKMGAVAKSAGQHPGAQNPLSPRAKRALKWGTDHVLTEEQQASMSKDGFSETTKGYMLQLLRSPIGEPFRQPFSRLVNTVIFGVPRSNRVNILFAVRCLTALVLSSLKEDDYGQAAKDVPAVIREFTDVIQEVRKFLAVFQPSWTDVDFKGERSSAEVEEVLAELRVGLEGILLAFGEYAASLGMSALEVKRAREAVGKGV